MTIYLDGGGGAEGLDDYAASLVTAEGTDEEHARARALGAAYLAGRRAAPRAEGLDVERLAEALHPKGKGPVVDCCMGSTVEGLYKPDEAERRHRAYHRRDAEALAAEYARLSHPSDEREDRCVLPGCEYLREEHGAMEVGPQYKADHFYVAPRAEGLDVETVARVFEGDIGTRIYFFGAAYGHPVDESWEKIAADFAAEYDRLSHPSDEVTDDPTD